MKTSVTINPVMNNGETKAIDLDVKFKYRQGRYILESYDYSEAGLSYDNILTVEEYLRNNGDVIKLAIESQMYE